MEVIILLRWSYNLLSNVSIGHSIADDGQSAVHGECFDFFLKKILHESRRIEWLLNNPSTKKMMKKHDQFQNVCHTNHVNHYVVQTSSMHPIRIYDTFMNEIASAFFTLSFLSQTEKNFINSNREKSN